ETLEASVAPCQGLPFLFGRQPGAPLRYLYGEVFDLKPTSDIVGNEHGFSEHSRFTRRSCNARTRVARSTLSQRLRTASATRRRSGAFSLTSPRPSDRFTCITRPDQWQVCRRG